VVSNRCKGPEEVRPDNNQEAGLERVMRLEVALFQDSEVFCQRGLKWQWRGIGYPEIEVTKEGWLMKVEVLKRAVTLAKKVGYVFVATAHATGLPHVAAAGKIRLTPDEGRVAVEAWFCPGTVANLQSNQHTALVIWDPNIDNGYQLLGETEKVEDTAIMNGYGPGLEDKSALPQVERRLLIRVDKIIGFRRSPHTDEED
jgi:hypothetical protein